MAHGSLKEFDPTQESIDDFKERFEFYCLANSIRSETNDHARRKKALFVTLLGQKTFVKLKSLAHPAVIADLTLDAIMEHLLAHFRPQTIEIAERYKFFKHSQRKGETASEFMAANGVNHRRVPPYHPSSNGAAENLVKLVKRSLEKAEKSVSIETKISRFLASYRNTPHSVTGRTPAEILLGRSPRTRLSLVHPCLSNRLTEKAESNVGDTQPRSFDVGQEVAVRDFRPHSTVKWQKATITKRLGPLSYEVLLEGRVRTAHVDHLRPWSDSQSTSTESPVENQTIDDSTIVLTEPDDVTMSQESNGDTSNDSLVSVAIPPLRHSQRARKQSKRLIENMN